MAVARTIATNYTAKTKQFEAGQQRMQDASKKTKGSILDISSESGKLAGVVGSSFSAMSAGIGVATANADQLGLAFVGAGGAMAASFASGGPIGLAIAGVATLAGWLSRTDEEAGKAAEAISKEFTEALKKANKELKKLTDENEELAAEKTARALGIPVATALADLRRGRAVQSARAEAVAAQRAYTSMYRAEYTPEYFTDAQGLEHGRMRQRMVLRPGYTAGQAETARRAAASAGLGLDTLLANQQLRINQGKDPATARMVMEERAKAEAKADQKLGRGESDRVTRRWQQEMLRVQKQVAAGVAKPAKVAK